MLSFQGLTAQDQETVRRYTAGSRLSFFQFTNMYMWRYVMQYRIAEEDGILYATTNYHGRHFCALFPFCEREREEEAFFRLRQAFPGPLTIRPVSEAVADRICDLCPGAEKSFLRGGSDYLYRTSDLISLAGKKYHTKKNHLNAFLSAYRWEYHDITADSKPEEKALLEQAAKRLYIHGISRELDEEHDANMDMIANLDRFSLRGAVLSVDEIPVAYTVGEQITADTALIHIEKADKNIRGAYAAINQMFAERAWSHLAWINREEDMGIPGLRRAKESYHPAAMNEVWSVRLP